MSIKKGCTWTIGAITGAVVGFGVLALVMILLFSAFVESCIG